MRKVIPVARRKPNKSRVRGDEIVATIDGIGTLTLPVVAEDTRPEGTGAFLPPVSSYRR
jgi:hypothetical protein